jgi:hypothetical protein
MNPLQTGQHAPIDLRQALVHRRLISPGSFAQLLDFRLSGRPRERQHAFFELRLHIVERLKGTVVPPIRRLWSGITFVCGKSRRRRFLGYHHLWSADRI